MASDHIPSECYAAFVLQPVCQYLLNNHCGWLFGRYFRLQGVVYVLPARWQWGAALRCAVCIGLAVKISCVLPHYHENDEVKVCIS